MCDISPKVYHKQKPPYWLRCASKSAKKRLRYKVLEDNIPTLELALASEAIHAARSISAEPTIARGGPWSKKTLNSEMIHECHQVATISSVMQLQKLASQNPEGRLARHLADLTFERASEAPNGTPTHRGAYVVKKRKSGQSGVPGNATRKRLLREKRLRRGTDEWRRAKRGVDVAERRELEQSHRKPRPRAGRV